MTSATARARQRRREQQREAAEEREAAFANAELLGFPGAPLCEHCGAYLVVGPLAMHIEAIRMVLRPSAGATVVLNRFLRLRTTFQQDELLAVCTDCWCVHSLETGRHEVGAL